MSQNADTLDAESLSTLEARARDAFEAAGDEAHGSTLRGSRSWPKKGRSQLASCASCVQALVRRPRAQGDEGYVFSLNGLKASVSTRSLRTAAMRWRMQPSRRAWLN